MTGRMEYLIGSRPQLESVWRAWNILAKGATERDPPDLVEHSALIYGISASGRITTLYSSNFSPARSSTTCRSWRRSRGRHPPRTAASAW